MMMRFIFRFLNNLFFDNLLTIPSIYYFIDFYRIESSLPMMFIIVNDRNNVSYEEQYKNIHENQQVFITSYDIYNTIANLIYGDKYYLIKNMTNEINDTIHTPKSKLGISLFMEINKKSRYPSKYTDMEKNICI